MPKHTTFGFGIAPTLTTFQWPNNNANVNANANANGNVNTNGNVNANIAFSLPKTLIPTNVNGPKPPTSDFVITPPQSIKPRAQTLPKSFPKATIHTLYIPYISDEYGLNEIRYLFTKYAIAMVKDVDFVIKMNYDTGCMQRSAYVHIKYWFYSRVAANFVQRLIDGKETRFIINDPEYWLILPSNAKKHTQNGRKLAVDLGPESNAKSLLNIYVYDEFTAYEFEKMIQYDKSNMHEHDAIVETVYNTPNKKYTNGPSGNQQSNEDEKDEKDIETTATSYKDTLDIGLHDEDFYMSSNSDNESSYTSFSDESVEDYRNDRLCNRRKLYCN